MARKVCVAGTFNTVHSGHLALLKKAFESGDEIFIGLTSDSLARKGRKLPVKNYASRKKGLLAAIKKISGRKKFHVLMLNDEFGPAASEDYNTIVVSKFTAATARKINSERKKNGLNPLDIIEIELVMAEDGKPITSTRVLEKKITLDGKIK